ncbi:MAG TPA: 16S rRNA (adenine(1518)-N(6)/adenine(1519)-N(6))-dimethyltransferase RsmA [Cryomorphaceae bacterium]|nr:16S rRNA (adenine(1518)-N(6)/adenine(1519)-N(6))-dimethyltransferase RsmA [Cryomorphaceae bacterium]
MVRAKKHLGQHFLRETAIADKIAGSLLSEQSTSRILEIGPGMGILTKSLLDRNFKRLKLIEIDRESVEYLHAHFPSLSEDILEADFLKIDLKSIFDAKAFSIIGNFPYNISSQILFRVFENRELIPEVVGMFQREVAQRITSGHGTKDYGILSVLLQVYYDATYLFTVEEDAFIPPPKVKSGVLRLVRNVTKSLPISDSFFKAVVKAAFNQRRKTLRNSLSAFLTKPHPEELAEILSRRPEQMSPTDFVALAKSLNELKNPE